MECKAIILAHVGQLTDHDLVVLVPGDQDAIVAEIWTASSSG